MKHQAILNLYPNVVGISDSGAIDKNGNKIAIEELAVEKEIARLQSEYDAKEYQRKRASEYPSIGDQLDALWKGGAEAEAMLAKVQAVKNKYPKGVA
jgi:hypothetical protein